MNTKLRNQIKEALLLAYTHAVILARYAQDANLENDRLSYKMMAQKFYELSDAMEKDTI
jgi:hypothetical protein